MTRDEIIAVIESNALIEDEIILFDGMEDAFLGVAERFAEEGHRYFAVYSYKGMVDILTDDGDAEEDAVDYLEYNTVGLYAGPGTPAILRDYP